MRTVLVTGASRGLGRAITEALVARDWYVLAGVRNPAAFVSPDPNRCEPLALDLLDPESIAAAVTTLVGRGRLDALVSNAGITAYGPFEETPPEVWADVFATNTFGPMRLTQLLLPALRDSRGRIVIVSSEAASYGMPAVGIYAASKAATSRWAEGLAHELAPLGVRVTLLEPGGHQTDIAFEFPRYGVADGPYAPAIRALERRVKVMQHLLRPTAGFGTRVADILDDDRPPWRRPVGPDAWAINVGVRVLPTRLLARLVQTVSGVSRGSRRSDSRDPRAGTNGAGSPPGSSPR
jgi:NAD(P)-dependent dehydrogenase (short-subunit alcohol dehydrogenase family)